MRATFDMAVPGGVRDGRVRTIFFLAPLCLNGRPLVQRVDLMVALADVSRKRKGNPEKVVNLQKGLG